jgi:tellurite resistance protein TerB
MIMFSKLAGKLFRGAKKVENRDLMEAIVGGGLLVAAADGEIEKDELNKLEKLIAGNENLKHFGADIGKTIRRFSDLLEGDFLVGRSKILREIRDIAGNDDHVEDVVLNVLAIAKADGEVEPEERKVIEEIARELGYRLSEEHFEIRKGA